MRTERGKRRSHGTDAAPLPTQDGRQLPSSKLSDPYMKKVTNKRADARNQHFPISLARRVGRAKMPVVELNVKPTNG